MINKKKRRFEATHYETINYNPQNPATFHKTISARSTSTSFLFFLSLYKERKEKKKKKEFGPTDYETLDQRVSPLDSLSFTLFFQMYSIITQ